MSRPDAPYDPPYPLTQFQSGINSRLRPVMGSAIILTSAQLLALQTTAIGVEPSPSLLAVPRSKVNLLLVLEHMAFEYIPYSVAYTLAGTSNFMSEYIGKRA